MEKYSIDYGNKIIEFELERKKSQEHQFKCKTRHEYCSKC